MISFVALMFAEMVYNGGNLKITFKDATDIKFDHHLITAFSVIVFSFNTQFLVFPAY